MPKDGASALRIILYPGAGMPRAIVHSLASILGVLIAWRFGFGSAWWAYLVLYIATFVGFHAVMVPVMTAWHAFLTWAERWVRSIVEEEMIRSDLKNYEKQLRRVFPGRDSRER